MSVLQSLLSQQETYGTTSAIRKTNMHRRDSRLLKFSSTLCQSDALSQKFVLDKPVFTKYVIAYYLLRNLAFNILTGVKIYYVDVSLDMK